MWKIIPVAALIVLVLLIIPASATASAGFAVGPPHIEVKVPADGNSTAIVYITSMVDGEIVVGTEGIPFLVEPGIVQVSSTDEYREIVLRFYGNDSVEAGRYSGNITFLLYTSDTVAYGVKITADVTQRGHGGVVEHIIRTLQANYVLIIVGCMVVIALVVSVLIGRRTKRPAQSRK